MNFGGRESGKTFVFALLLNCSREKKFEKEITFFDWPLI